MAAEINGMMPSVVTSMVADGLNRVSKSIRGSKILILGVAYKKNVSDCRESPALDVMRLLKRKGRAFILQRSVGTDLANEW